MGTPRIWNELLLDDGSAELCLAASRILMPRKIRATTKGYARHSHFNGEQRPKDAYEVQFAHPQPLLEKVRKQYKGGDQQKSHRKNPLQNGSEPRGRPTAF